MRRCLAIALSVGLLGACGASSDSSSPTSAAQLPSLNGQALSVGALTIVPPFASLDASDALEGFDIDLVTEICRRVNCNPTFQAAEFATVFDDIEAGTYDLVSSSITITPERAARFDFSRPYVRAGQVITVQSNSDISNVEQAKENTVGVLEGSSGDLPGFNTQGYPATGLVMAALAEGEVDAIILDALPSLRLVIEDYPGKLKVLDTPFTTEYYGVVIPKSSTDVKAAFDAAIAQLDEDGVLEKLAAKWNIPGRAVDSLPDEPTFPVRVDG